MNYTTSSLALSTDGTQLFVAAGHRSSLSCSNTLIRYDVDPGSLSSHLTNPQVWRVAFPRKYQALEYVGARVTCLSAAIALSMMAEAIYIAAPEQDPNPSAGCGIGETPAPVQRTGVRSYVLSTFPPTLSGNAIFECPGDQDYCYLGMVWLYMLAGQWCNGCAVQSPW